jgi:hypothetical protein
VAAQDDQIDCVVVRILDRALCRRALHDHALCLYAQLTQPAGCPGEVGLGLELANLPGHGIDKERPTIVASTSVSV